MLDIKKSSKKKDSIFEKLIVSIGLVLIFIGINSYSNKVEKKDNTDKDTTEIAFFNIDSKDVKQIEFYKNQNEILTIIDDKYKIKSILNSFKLSSYGIASHPSSVNSDSIYIKIINYSNQELYSLFGNVMNEGPNHDVIFYNIQNKPTHRYKSFEPALKKRRVS